MGKNKSKKTSGVVFSTNPSFEYDDEETIHEETLSPEEQLLYVSIDKKQRKGKEVTLVEGFVGTDDDLKSLSKVLKTACGVGGSAKNNEIIIQGNVRDKVLEILSKNGYKTKRKGG